MLKLTPLVFFAFQISPADSKPSPDEPFLVNTSSDTCWTQPSRYSCTHAGCDSCGFGNGFACCESTEACAKGVTRGWCCNRETQSPCGDNEVPNSTVKFATCCDKGSACCPISDKRYSAFISTTCCGEGTFCCGANNANSTFGGGCCDIETEVCVMEDHYSDYYISSCQKKNRSEGLVV